MKDDYISRQAAIDALKEKVFSNLTDEFYGAMQVLDELPSAEPPYKYSESYVEQIRTERDFLQDMVNNMAEPKTGKWILPNGDLTDRPMAECDQCGWYVDPNHTSEYDFCPHCGSYNGGEAGDSNRD